MLVNGVKGRHGCSCHGILDLFRGRGGITRFFVGKIPWRIAGKKEGGWRAQGKAMASCRCAAVIWRNAWQGQWVSDRQYAGDIFYVIYTRVSYMTFLCVLLGEGGDTIPPPRGEINSSSKLGVPAPLGYGRKSTIFCGSKLIREAELPWVSKLATSPNFSLGRG